jgi:hypothetical protein
MDLDGVMHNLRIVAMVKEQDKLITGPRFGLRSPSNTRAVLRWWHGETRERDIYALRSLVSAAVNLAQLSATLDAQDMRNVAGGTSSTERLIEAIRLALGGLGVLTRTYHDDHEVCAQIELLLQDARDRLEFIRPGSCVYGSASPSVRETSPHIENTQTAPQADLPPPSPRACPSPRAGFR